MTKQKATVFEFEEDQTIVINYLSGDRKDGFEVCSANGIEYYSNLEELEEMYPKYASAIEPELAKGA
jgi:hypothetical protein